MLCVIYSDAAVSQAKRSSHTGPCDPQWSSSQYAVMSPLTTERIPSTVSFHAHWKTERALLCPCRAHAVVPTALYLAGLWWDWGPSFASLEREKIESLEFSAGACVTLDFHRFKEEEKKTMKIITTHTHTHTHARTKGISSSSVTWICPITTVYFPQRRGFLFLGDNNTRREEKLSESWGWDLEKFDPIGSNQVRAIDERIIWNMTL